MLAIGENEYILIISKISLVIKSIAYSRRYKLYAFSLYKHRIKINKKKERV
jgi:hypothetical protein